MTEYRNPWYSPRGNDPEVYRTAAEPIEYKGYLIYNRIKAPAHRGGCWDVVKDGTCVGQYAGRSGAEQFIDGGCKRLGEEE